MLLVFCPLGMQKKIAFGIYSNNIHICYEDCYYTVHYRKSSPFRALSKGRELLRTMNFFSEYAFYKKTLIQFKRTTTNKYKTDNSN